MKFILLFFLLLPPLLAADTLRFSLQQDDGQAHFNYRFSVAGQAQHVGGIRHVEHQRIVAEHRQAVPAKCRHQDWRLPTDRRVSSWP